MTDKRETAGGKHYPSRVSIPVPRERPRETQMNSPAPPAPPSPPPPSPPPLPPSQDASDRTVEAPIVMQADLSGVKYVPPTMPGQPAVSTATPIFTSAPPQPTASPLVGQFAPGPPGVPQPPSSPAWTPADPSADLRSEIQFYRKLVVGLLATVIVLMLVAMWLATRNRA